MRSHRTSRFFLTLILTCLCFIRVAAAPTDGRSRSASPDVVDLAVLGVNQIDCYIQNNGKIGERSSSGGDGFFYPKGQRNTSILFTGGSGCSGW